MQNILAVTVPIYAVILIGFLTTRMGLFARSESLVLGRFVINLALPALVFNALAQRQLREIFNLGYLLAYLAGSLAVLALGYAWCRRVSGKTPLASTLAVMGMSCSNSGFVGYPILLLTLAPVAGVALALNMVVENVVMIPLLLALADRGRGDAEHGYQRLVQSALRLLRQPLILGLLAGLAVSLMGWKLPQPLARTVNMFSLASGALSLFVIGAGLVGLPLQGMLGRAAPIALGKLLAHPVAVALAFYALPGFGLPVLDPALHTAGVLLAAMPMMGIYPILAQRYEKESHSSAALLITTVASFFSLSALLWLLNSMHGGF